MNENLTKKTNNFDKYLHAFVGFVLAVIGGLFSSAFLGLGAKWTMFYMVLLPVLGAVGKEIIDATDKHNRFDWRDIFATLVGAGILWFFAIIILLTN